MYFFVVYKEKSKLQHAEQISEYSMLQMIATQIEEEDVKVEYATKNIQYIGFLPKSFSCIKEYVDHVSENEMTNHPILAVFRINRHKTITKIFRKGIPDLVKFIKSGQIESKSEEIYLLNKEFKQLDSVIDDETRNAIGKLLMNQGLNKTTAQLKFEYVGARVAVKQKLVTNN